jgi:hypothetical protein
LRSAGRKTPVPVSRHNIDATRPIKRALLSTWCFRLSVAKLQHSHNKILKIFN